MYVQVAGSRKIATEQQREYNVTRYQMVVAEAVTKHLEIADTANVTLRTTIGCMQPLTYDVRHRHAELAPHATHPTLQLAPTRHTPDLQLVPTRHTPDLQLAPHPTPRVRAAGFCTRCSRRCFSLLRGLRLSPWASATLDGIGALRWARPTMRPWNSAAG